MQREKSASASAMRTSDVVFGFIWQACFTSDDVQFLSVIGAGMVMAGVCIIVIFKSQSVPRDVSDSPNITKNDSIHVNVASSTKEDSDLELSQINRYSPSLNSDEPVISALHIGKLIKSSLAFGDHSKPIYMPLDADDKQVDGIMCKSVDEP
jgi:hypothetical protein